MLELVWRYAWFFLVIIGGAPFENNLAGAGLTGIVLMCALAFASWRQLHRADMRLVLCCWFVVATAAAITIGRAEYLAPDYVLTTRYSFISVVFLCTIVLLFQSRIIKARLWLASIVVILAALHCLWAYRTYSYALHEDTRIRIRTFNEIGYPAFGLPFEATHVVVEQAIAMGLYRPPCRPLPTCEKKP